MRAVPSSLAIRQHIFPSLSPSTGPTVLPDDFTGKPYKQCQMTLGVSAASKAQHERGKAEDVPHGKRRQSSEQGKQQLQQEAG